MEKRSEILERINRSDGMTVPEGYFADFVTKMSETLPAKQPDAFRPKAPRTFWQKVRPYAYMAAMFAGIWCMMKMFSMFGGQTVDLSVIDNHPGVISALNDDGFVNDYVYPQIEADDILDDLYDSGLSVDELFGDDSDDSAFDETVFE